MMANDMGELLYKAEKHLGLEPLVPYLPKKYNKDKWAEWVCTRSLDTFSRFFPWQVPFHVTPEVPKIDGWYVIDEEKYFGREGILLGVQDINWQDFSSRNLSIAQLSGYGSYMDFWGMNFNLDDIAGMQVRADAQSMYNTGIYIDTMPPNKFKITSLTNTDVVLMNDFVVNIILKHPDTLHTIEPTKMEIFENLAYADIADFLFSNLRYWDQMETVFATIDLKLADLEREADKRDQIVEELKNSYVTPQNKSIPYLLTI